MRRALLLPIVLGSLALVPAAGSGSPALHVSLTAATHHPQVNARWSYTVHATDPRGRKVDAVVSPRIVYNGKTVDTLGYYGFKGQLTRTYKWPASTRGKSLDFTVRVQGLGKVVFATYPVTVR